MDRLIASNSVPLAQADTAPATGTPQYATDGNPASNVPATLWPAYAWNALQDEIYNVIIAAGLTPNRNTWNQLLTAIQTMLQGSTTNVGTDTGAANAYVVAFTPALTAPVPWVPFWIKIAHANTGASTLNATGTVEPFLGGAHLALQGGELVANGNALVYWNPTLASGAGSYVLLFCSGAPEQVANATEPQHAVAAGQLNNGTLKGIQSFTSSGTFTAPVTGTYYWSGCAPGGGGGGGGGTVGSSGSVGGGGGGGGGAGQAVIRQAVNLTAGQTVSITIGAAGTGGTAGQGTGTSGGAGVSGGTTVFGAPVSTTLAGGSGGAGGGGQSSTTAAVPAGSAGGVGGSGYPQGQAGGDGNYAGLGGIGASGPFGGGGGGGRASTVTISAQAGAGAYGNGAGGGGGGASYGNGGAQSAGVGGTGTGGRAIIEW